MTPDPIEDAADDESDWTTDDIELAYQKALEAFDDTDGETFGESDGDESTADEPVAETGSPVDMSDEGEDFADALDGEVPESDDAGDEEAEQTADAGAVDIIPVDVSEESAEPAVEGEVAPAEPQKPARVISRPASRRPAPAAPAAEAVDSSVTPAQVIEAALFVGGPPLTAGKLYALLRGTISVEQVPEIIDELNSLFTAQGRPYEIRLGDGGYRLELKPEYERLKLRVFGQGPREVKLAQDALEVLALVAYRQPISQQEVEGHGKLGAGNLLRQLLRRDLVQIERGEQGPRDVKYRTTPRFLSVFGLASLAELPQPEDLAAR